MFLSFLVICLLSGELNTNVIKARQKIEPHRDPNLIHKNNITTRLDKIFNRLTDTENVCIAAEEKIKHDIMLSKTTEKKDVDFMEGCKKMVGKNISDICLLVNELYLYHYRSQILPKHCKEIQDKENNGSKIYKIHPKHSPKPFMVFCDMETKNGGWIVIQRRIDALVNFDRTWRDYKFGFGYLNHEFWIGLEHIHHLTSTRKMSLLIELTSKDTTEYVEFDDFKIGSEREGYPLAILGRYTGSLNDAMRPHLKSVFSTVDLDQDNYTDQHCAMQYKAGWWFNNDCFECNLNGKYIHVLTTYDHYGKCIMYGNDRDTSECYSGSRMLIRPH